MYYLRTKPAAAAIQFTVDKTKLKAEEAHMATMTCSLQNKDVRLLINFSADRSRIY